jgi:hypothetical protein
MRTYICNPSNLPLYAIQTVWTSLIWEQVLCGSGCIRLKIELQGTEQNKFKQNSHTPPKNLQEQSSKSVCIVAPPDASGVNTTGGKEWQVKVGWLCLNTKKNHAAVSPSLSLTLQQCVIVQIVVPILHLLWQPEVHYRIHSLHSTSIFSSVTQSVSPPLDIHAGTTLTSASTCYNWSRHFRVYNYKLVRRSHFSNACHLPHPSRSQDPCYLPSQSCPRISLTSPQLLS